ncbi:hypothetical protein ACGFZQ_42070 [Streptomyces sp. NPDC048254]|uniref:hypothetical protein n=1 Tax=Streptomyces sp. NPDC048254 TaxID=3365525 RepID=UPI0037143992
MSIERFGQSGQFGYLQGTHGEADPQREPERSLLVADPRMPAMNRQCGIDQFATPQISKYGMYAALFDNTPEMLVMNTGGRLGEWFKNGSDQGNTVGNGKCPQLRQSGSSCQCDGQEFWNSVFRQANTVEQLRFEHPSGSRIFSAMTPSAGQFRPT